MKIRRLPSLPAASAHAFSAGRFRGYRDVWLTQAKHNKTNRDLRALQISFAKSAHRAYMNDLARARQAVQA